jgi:aryl-alcohol dehydrogenase-like predicted oxidoreductase
MATAEATKRYAERMSSSAAPGHFREQQGLTLSSIGIGTYLGEADAATDENYRRAIVKAVEMGANVIDTAINYRFQRSERSIGQAIQDLEQSGRAKREELVVATKAGYIAFDGNVPPDPREYFRQTFVVPGIVGRGDVVAGSHCMAPKYLEHEMEQSLRNMGIRAIDIFYVHNPESQLSEIQPRDFNNRLRMAFGFLEQAVQAGKIRMYGVATWNAFRVQPGSQDYLSIEDVVRCARDVAGDGHHFRVVQFPYNLAMPEAFTLANQKLGSKIVTMLEACHDLGISVMASASMLQSRLSRNLPDFVAASMQGLRTDSQRAIQFVRSTPGITVALVGMSRTHHVEENLHTATVPPSPESVRALFNAA